MFKELKEKILEIMDKYAKQGIANSKKFYDEEIQAATREILKEILKNMKGNDVKINTIRLSSDDELSFVFDRDLGDEILSVGRTFRVSNY